ncbi:TPR repeat [Rhodovulum sp. ES.010]|uniref:peptidoglycan-binding protein n=1 Tax=Rhodovulum sp. ES.010 TaxID=1882821 RepID=UPI00092AD3E9|nr:peptidoglycan-binding protein [Rhodovulum sp. ES.010]SIO30432.1 TPR repeat [Rhodovulum sp. ES.010]
MSRLAHVLCAALLIGPLSVPAAGQAPADVEALHGDLFSTDTATRDAALEQLRALAGAGDAEAAGILSRQFDEDGDRQAAIDILGPAAAAGDIPTIRRLTWLLRDSGADAADILDTLRLGWEAGDVVSGMQYARTLMRAEDPDKRRTARQVYEAAAALPGFTAWSDLARMRKTGSGGPADPEGAFEATRNAAEAGDAWSSLHLGRMQMNGAGTAPDPAAALESFQAAMAGEGEVVATARRELAAGHLYRKFGPLSDPAAGLDLAADGVAAGDAGMVRLVVTMRAEKGALGQRAEALRTEALARAEKAAAAGDERAARSLFDYWHRRATRSAQASPEAAAIVAAHGALLDRPRLVRHELVATAPRLQGRAARGTAVAQLETLEGKAYAAALVDLRPHRMLYIQAVQSRLAEAGFYTGAIDGLMGPRTQRAIDAFCTRYGVEAACRKGLYSWQFGEAVGTHLAP